MSQLEASGGGQMKLPTAYLICTTPRTGSTLLCEGLASTGRIGLAREYFSLPLARLAALKWRCRDLACYLQCIAEQPEALGQCILKIHWDQLDLFLARLSTPRGVDDVALLMGGVAETVRVVHLVRDDVVKQAVSNVVAIQRGRWHARDSEGISDDAVFYDPRHISSYVELIEHWNAEWSRTFERTGLDVLRVRYESIVEDYESVVLQVASWLVEDPVVGPLPAPRLTPTNTALTDSYVERYAKTTGRQWQA